MNWIQIFVLSSLAVVLLFTVKKTETAAVRPDRTDAEGTKDFRNSIFLKDSDAVSFFKTRKRRSTKSRDEVNAENRQRLAADRYRRNYYEEKQNEFRKYVEEERDEQYERNREVTEQWRQWHYDGRYPSYQYNRHHV
ncbi:unique cartilage matrix-associated protein [Protopterus annectens]|uniref:unique cartilage matrix-associated protein n=1 Tax=Protopterus annectens TaxID=7888 RepID=UPI001CFA800F|nr:unique cartilage matrix-associated protein [Protopterus annectens]